MSKERKHLTSLLIPLGGQDKFRFRTWAWLLLYWMGQFHDDEVEIVIGRDRQSEQWFKRNVPFSKTSAVNDAFSKSHGDVIVILDADAYLGSSIISECADRIRLARDRGVKVWFVPYTHIYRLTKAASHVIINSDPLEPVMYSDPPPPALVEEVDIQGPSNTNSYGAMIQVMPREAFKCVGGMDPRFRGWGGEDVSFMTAITTLWACPPKFTDNGIFHLWHPTIDAPHDKRRPWARWQVRMWGGQTDARVNDWLAASYKQFEKWPNAMRQLVDEGLRLERDVKRNW